MPYIIEIRSTGRRPNDNPLGMWSAMAKQGRLKNVVVSRTAVATLDEAREHIGATLHGEGAPKWCGLDVSGGTVGPLPDGTVIEVRRISDLELRRRIGRPTFRGPIREAIEAFNAAHYSAA